MDRLKMVSYIPACQKGWVAHTHVGTSKKCGSTESQKFWEWERKVLYWATSVGSVFLKKLVSHLVYSYPSFLGGKASNDEWMNKNISLLTYLQQFWYRIRFLVNIECEIQEVWNIWPWHVQYFHWQLVWKLIRYERKTKLNQVFVSSAEPGWVPVANLMSMKRLYCIHLQILLLGKLFVWIFVEKKTLGWVLF